MRLAPMQFHQTAARADASSATNVATAGSTCTSPPRYRQRSRRFVACNPIRPAARQPRIALRDGDQVSQLVLEAPGRYIRSVARSIESTRIAAPSLHWVRRAHPPCARDAVEGHLAEAFLASSPLQRAGAQAWTSSALRTARGHDVGRSLGRCAPARGSVGAFIAPLVHIFCPSTRQPSPSGVARVRGPARSEPGLGSEKPWHQISRISRIAGR